MPLRAWQGSIGTDLSKGGGATETLNFGKSSLDGMEVSNSLPRPHRIYSDQLYEAFVVNNLLRPFRTGATTENRHVEAQGYPF